MISSESKMSGSSSSSYKYSEHSARDSHNYNSQMAQKIYHGDYKIAVFGLGHVGSAMASVWLRTGAHVIGVDKSPTVLDNARKGKTHLPEPGVNDAYREGISSGRFIIYDDLERASRESFLKMICVPRSEER